MMSDDLQITDTWNFDTEQPGFVVHGELAPEQVLTAAVGEHVIIVTCRTAADIDPIVADFDAASASSPSAGDSREIARPIVQHIADGGS